MPLSGLNRTWKTRRTIRWIDDKSVRNPGFAPPRLFEVRNGIHLRSGRAVLVRRGNRQAANAQRSRGLPLPRLLAEGCRANPAGPGFLSVLASALYFTTAAVCPNSSLRSSSVRIVGLP